MLKALPTLLLLGTALALPAQTATTPIPPPIAAEQIAFRHWPQQFVQWLGAELPYSMIELYVDPKAGATPLYEAVLTERATGKRIHYTNQQQMVDITKRSGAEAYLANMQLDTPAAMGTGATWLLRFVDHSGEPVSWQWIQGSDMSERGGGSSPAGSEPPVLVYRTRSAVAGEGSALKIGKAVSVAEVWTEISQPPYFIAYHGAFSEDVDIAVFAAAPVQWATVTAPTALAVGAEWKLKAQDGLSSSLRVQALAGAHATIVNHDDHFPGRTITLEADWNMNKWSIEKMRYAAEREPENEGITITFSPAAHADGSPSKFEVQAGHNTRIAGGTVHADAAQSRVGWEFKNPDWLHGKTAWVSSVLATTTADPAQTASR